MMIE
jgi:hypothetical protein